MKLKDTSQLAEDDIILHYGMRILIDGPAVVTQKGTGRAGALYHWPGLVLNADELCDKDSPSYDAYIASHLRGIWWEDRVPRPRKDDWPIQGNYLASWTLQDR
jgi:hypothetical protein